MLLLFYSSVDKKTDFLAFHLLMFNSGTAIEHSSKKINWVFNIELVSILKFQ